MKYRINLTAANGNETGIGISSMVITIGKIDNVWSFQEYMLTVYLPMPP